MRLIHLGYSTSLLALTAALALGATDARAADPATAPATTDATAPAVGEVVVTAQKRNERAVNVPISIQAFSGAQLQQRNIVSDAQLQEITPALRMDQTGVFVVPTIRGIGTPVTGSGLSPTAIYVDGVYQQDALGMLFDLNNVQSVQVLKGPQGTLFGRNTEAGAILIDTLNPSDRFDFRALGDVGNYNERKANIYISGPLIGDTLSANLDVYTRHNDGYLTNIFSGSKTDGQISEYNVTGKLLWRPTDQISFLLKLSHVDAIDQSAANYVAAVDPLTGKGYAKANIVPGACVATSPYTTCSAEPPQNRVLQDAATLKSTFNFGWATLTSYSSIVHDHDTEGVEQDSSNLNLSYFFWHVHEQFEQQEFDLAGHAGDKFNWVLGAYLAHDWSFQPAFYSVSNKGTLPTITGYNVLNTATQLLKDTNYAFFADGTYQVVPKLYIDLGVRYSIEPKSVYVQTSQTTPSESGLSASTTFYSFTPKGSIRYEFAPNSNIYYTYSVGYKSGLFNTTVRFIPVHPETLYANEVGIKTSQSNWSFDAAAFYYNYDNLQFQNTIAGIGSITSNAGNAVSYGAEANFNYRFNENLSFTLSGAYTHAHYTSFLHAVISYPCSAGLIASPPSNAVTPVCNVAAGHPSIVDFGDYQDTNINVSGNEMIRAPEFTLAFSPDYRIPTSFGTFELSGNLYASSRVYMQADDALIFSQAPYATLDLNGSWTPDGHYKIALWGTNVTNTRYINQASPDAASARLRYAAPTEFGVTFSYRN